MRLLASALVLSFASSLIAQATHWPSSEDLRHRRAVRALALSPDAHSALLAIAESTADGAVTHLWIAATDGSSHPRQLTFSSSSDKQGEHGGQWSPDGLSLYFLAHRSTFTGLYRLNLAGGEAEPIELKVPPAIDDSKLPGAIPPAEKDEKSALAPEPLDVEGYALAPSGRWLALWARDPETAGERHQKEARADAHLADHERHQMRLYLYAIEAEGTIAARPRVAQLQGEVTEARWSPTGDRLLVLSEPPNQQNDLGPANSLWMVQAANPGQPQRLTSLPLNLTEGFGWSPDGRALFFAAQSPDDAPPGYSELFSLAVDQANAKPRRLTAGFQGQIKGDATFFNGNSELIALAGIGTLQAPVRIRLDAASAPEALKTAAPVAYNLTTNAARSGWLWNEEGAGSPVRLCFAAQIGQPCKSLALPRMEPDSLRHAKAELVTWQNGDFKLEGLLYLPEAQPSARIPLVVDVHGGPFGAWVQNDSAFVSFLLGQGWAVFEPNPRGSSNYGTHFAAANKDDLGGADYTDIMTGLDAVIASHSIDTKRLALYGYSYGGEMAAFVEGKTDRFRAIISAAPVIDQFSEYGTEKGSWYDRWYFGLPWVRQAEALRQSPLAGAVKAKSPFMLLQGEADLTDPLGQSQEMYRALRQQGVPVELVTYPREDHGPLSRGITGDPTPEPWHGFDARQRIVDFISREFAK